MGGDMYFPLASWRIRIPSSMVEQKTLNLLVPGSSPGGCISFLSKKFSKFLIVPAQFAVEIRWRYIRTDLETIDHYLRL